MQLVPSHRRTIHPHLLQQTLSLSDTDFLKQILAMLCVKINNTAPTQDDIQYWMNDTSFVSVACYLRDQWKQQSILNLCVYELLEQWFVNDARCRTLQTQLKQTTDLLTQTRHDMSKFHYVALSVCPYLLMALIVYLFVKN